MSGQDLEHGGPSAPAPTVPESSRQYHLAESSNKQWTLWLVETIVVTNAMMFIITMFVNNCPENNLRFQGSCLGTFLGLWRIPHSAPILSLKQA
ncbi:hypothetical protein CDL15_Pgr006186 [Punica granatum]|uniref:Uncharacterized protein n=1 Tax=Punica granatum TaxID=22663 RepID=A0A218VV50_PUNGR|nr:hypothetical protein CDL15_Pgr006186 [Punica granatum]